MLFRAEKEYRPDVPQLSVSIGDVTTSVEIKKFGERKFIISVKASIPIYRRTATSGGPKRSSIPWSLIALKEDILAEKGSESCACFTSRLQQ